MDLLDWIKTRVLLALQQFPLTCFKHTYHPVFSTNCVVLGTSFCKRYDLNQLIIDDGIEFVLDLVVSNHLLGRYHLLKFFDI